MIEGKYRIRIRFQTNEDVELNVPCDEEAFLNVRITAGILDHEEEGCRIGKIQLRIKEEDSLGEHPAFAEKAPVRVYASLAEKPEKITAMYLRNPWWTRPAFVSDIRDIPAKTQVAFFRFPDRCGCLLPMAGSLFKTSLCGGTETELCMEMSACTGGFMQANEELYLYAEAPTAGEAVHKVFSLMLRKKGIPSRENRRVPEMFRYLGWCSWDAFYTEVSEDKIRSKAEELASKNVPVRWMLIDDGWFPSRNKMISGFAPDKAKFKDGFRKMIAEIRDAGMVRWFGVWHALGGYWDGVDPESLLALEEAPYLHRNKNGRLVPDPKSGSGFYRDWCDVLKQEGIDFLKVDGQSASPFYFENEVPVCEAARGMNEALESGAYRMDGAIINCMGMAMENIAARPVSAISRNSDDFLPAQEESFTEHLLQNAYNSLYHNEIYCCDWDMFWSKHVHAVKHSLLRAVSGGPVYVSDKVSETDPDVLRSLAYQDGRLLMMNRSARPTEDCVFSDPKQDGVLKLHNTAVWGGKDNAGGIAAYNLTGAPQTVSFKPSDIPDVKDSGSYWIYDYFNKKVRIQGRNDEYTDQLGAGDFSWYVIVPAGRKGSCLGLLDKYAGFMAAENIWENDDSQIIVLHEMGTVGWASCEKPSEVLVNAEVMTDMVKRDGELWILELPEKTGKALLEIRW